MTQVKAGMDAGVSCPDCENGQLVVKFGKNGTFLGCSNYPTCAFTTTIPGMLKVKFSWSKKKRRTGPCPKCDGGRLVVKKTKTGGRFVACSNYPACRYTKSVGTGVACPQDGCEGELVEKTSPSAGSAIPAANTRNATSRSGISVAKPCPLCESKILVRESQARACTWPARTRPVASGKNWSAAEHGLPVHSAPKQQPFRHTLYFLEIERIIAEFRFSQAFITEVLFAVHGLIILAAIFRNIWLMA